MSQQFGKTMKTILSLTINPAIDASCSVETVFPDHKLRSGPVCHEPGGGGVNVSRAILNLGGDSTVFYVAGGPSGQMLGLLLDREGLKHEAILIEDWTRENFVVAERTSGQQYRFVTPGPDLRPEEWQSCLTKIGALDPMPDFVVASGSLPPGVPMDFYGQLAKIVSAKNGRFVLDSSGAALAEGLDSGGVYLVKPSLRELRALAQRELVQQKEQEEAAMEIVKNAQVQIVIVSMGAAGALLVTAAGCKRIPSPAVPVKSKVGAGDSMVAGIVLGLARDMPVPRCGVFWNRLWRRRGHDAWNAALPPRGRKAAFRADNRRIDKIESAYRLWKSHVRKHEQKMGGNSQLAPRTSRLICELWMDFDKIGTKLIAVYCLKGMFMSAILEPDLKNNQIRTRRRDECIKWFREIGISDVPIGRREDRFVRRDVSGADAERHESAGWVWDHRCRLTGDFLRDTGFDRIDRQMHLR